MNATPLYRQTFQPGELAGAYPPRFVHPHKRRIYDSACPDGPQTAGAVTVSRWAPVELSQAIATFDTEIVPRTGHFDYSSSGSGSVDWCVNFADSHLFGFYGGPLLAQDEHQVLEHPALAAVREGLIGLGLPALTAERGRGTPVLVSGVERRLVLSTAPDAAKGRPSGLYGKRFARASWEAVEGALQVLRPPSVSHILAMAAPACGHGAYTSHQVREILTVASTAFAAVVAETQHLFGATATPAVHTGFWGCGAFGGNRVMMAALQLAAARLVRLPRLVFFAFDEQGMADLKAGQQLLYRCWSDGVDCMVTRLTESGLHWGVSDGN